MENPPTIQPAARLYIDYAIPIHMLVVKKNLKKSTATIIPKACVDIMESLKVYLQVRTT